MEKKSIGFGARGTMLLVYQFLAYCTYCAFTNFPQNMAGQVMGAEGTPVIAQTSITFINLIGSLLGYCITYFIVAPRIGKMKSVKRTGLSIGVVALLCCAGVTLIPITTTWLWYIFFALVLITTQLWACFFATMLIGNWFPRRKGTVMGIVTMAFPLVTGLGLSVCYSQFFGAIMPALMTGQVPDYTMAFVQCFGLYWILGLISILICAIFLKDFPEQCGAYRDNDRSFTPEMAQKMMMAEIEARKKSVWKRSKIWGCKAWWLMAIPNGLLLSCAMAFMVQIIPVLNGYGEALDVLKLSDTFILLNSGPTTVLTGLAIFACFGSWFLGVMDTKFGTKTAVFITSIVMLAAGILGALNNGTALLISLVLIAMFMGASSNFTVSAAVQYWRIEDFPSVFSVVNPVANLINSFGPMVIAALLFTAVGPVPSRVFIATAIAGAVGLILMLLFKPGHVKAKDDKYRAAAGKPLDDVLAGRK